MIRYGWKPQWIDAPQLEPEDIDSLLKGERIVKDLGLQQWDLFRIGDVITVCSFSGGGECWLRMMNPDETSYLQKTEGLKNTRTPMKHCVTKTVAGRSSPPHATGDEFHAGIKQLTKEKEEHE